MALIKWQDQKLKHMKRMITTVIFLTSNCTVRKVTWLKFRSCMCVMLCYQRYEHVPFYIQCWKPFRNSFYSGWYHTFENLQEKKVKRILVRCLYGNRIQNLYHNQTIWLKLILIIFNHPSFYVINRLIYYGL